MNIQQYPEDLQLILNGMDYEKDNIGRSGSGVYRFYKDTMAYYLKVQSAPSELSIENEIMEWLQGKLPVPKKIYFKSYEGFDYLLMTEIEGTMLCSDYFLNDPEKVVRLLADGVKILQSISIEDCPFDNSLEVKLKGALYNIENNLVDLSDWEEENQFKTAIELLDYLVENKPKEDTVSFTHGDYCLPNIFARDNKIKGFIDLGRCGIADTYQDIALCIRSLRHNFGTGQYDDLFFSHLGIKPDWKKIEYYILLDELF